MTDRAMPGRVDWVDYAKGFTILLVVQMHVTLGIEDVLGRTSFMGQLVEFFRAFRMPLFFLVAGLFLSRSIDRTWRGYLDAKVMHFAYFYMLWTIILFSMKYMAAGQVNHPVTLLTLFEAVYEPIGVLWFIYMLAIFFVVTRIGQILGGPVLLAIAVGLYFLAPATEITLVDEFCARYVFFLAGYFGASNIFDYADRIKDRGPLIAAMIGGYMGLALLALWLGYARYLPVALPLAFAGALTTIAACSWLARRDLARWLRYTGQHSLFIFLSFFVPAAFMRIGLIKLDMVPEINLFALMTTIFAVCSSLLVYVIVRRTPLAFVYVRPELFKLG